MEKLNRINNELLNASKKKDYGKIEKLQKEWSIEFNLLLMKKNFIDSIKFFNEIINSQKNVFNFQILEFARYFIFVSSTNSISKNIEEEKENMKCSIDFLNSTKDILLEYCKKFENFEYIENPVKLEYFI